MINKKLILEKTSKNKKFEDIILIDRKFGNIKKQNWLIPFLYRISQILI